MPTHSADSQKIQARPRSPHSPRAHRSVGCHAGTAHAIGRLDPVSTGVRPGHLFPSPHSCLPWHQYHFPSLTCPLLAEHGERSRYRHPCFTLPYGTMAKARATLTGHAIPYIIPYIIHIPREIVPTASYLIFRPKIFGRSPSARAPASLRLAEVGTCVYCHSGKSWDLSNFKRLVQFLSTRARESASFQLATG